MQDVTNSGIWYLCKLADDLNNEPNGRVDKVRYFSFVCIFLHSSNKKGTWVFLRRVFLFYIEIHLL